MNSDSHATDDDLMALADEPALIDDIETCKAVLDALDRTGASIGASLDTARVRVQGGGLEELDEDWFHRASNARHHIEYKRRRVGKRLAKLERQNSPPLAPLPKTKVNIEIEKMRQQTHLESMRLAMDAKERRQAAQREHGRERERRFIDIARQFLPRDTYMQIWHEVDADEKESTKSSAET